MLPTIRGPLGYFLQPLDIVPVDCKPGYPGLLTWDHPSSDLRPFLRLWVLYRQLPSFTRMSLQSCNSNCLFGSTYLNMHEFQDTFTAPQHHKMW